MSTETSTENTPVLELRGLKVHHRTRTGSIFRPNIVKAVDGVDFTVRRGETVGVVGESGCGKSTLASVLVGLQEPTAGQVLFHGKPISIRRAADRKRFGQDVAVVFQDPSTALNPRMTIQDILTDPLQVHGIGDARSRAAKSPRYTLSRANGSRVKRIPVASRSALARAGATGLNGLSLMDLAPSGPSASSVSAKKISVRGTSAKVGTWYCRRIRVSTVPSALIRTSSNSAAPSACAMPPSIWPRHCSGFTTTPASAACTLCRMRISPVP